MTAHLLTTVVLVCLVVLAQGFSCGGLALNSVEVGPSRSAIHGVTIRFSRNFQRHVVYDSNNTVMGSYEFLDSAREDYPGAELVKLGTQTFDNQDICLGCYGGSGLEEQTAYREVLRTDTVEHSNRVRMAFDSLMTLAELAAEAPRAQNATAYYLVQNAGKLRFLKHSPESINANYKAIISLLKEYLGMDATYSRQHVLSKFPQLCLYNLQEITERLKFLLSPLPPPSVINRKDLDWPLLASQGYGAGLTKNQLREAVRAVPHILSMYYEDAAGKPSVAYYLYVLKAPFENVVSARVNLRDYLDGASVADMAYITYLGTLDISWDQLRVMLQAFPTIVVCDTEPSWEMLNKGNGAVRKQLKAERLHYLQTRLQIRPIEVKAMLITHNRLSTYSVVGKIKPTIDALQRKLGLRSLEVRMLLRRMPSLIGMSVKGFNERMNFFEDEIGMTIKDIRKAALRNPSLLQYSLKSLRQKVEYFHNQLEIPKDKLGKLVSTTPGIMGLSLEGNLKPSAKSFMTYVKLSPEEMGDIVARTPQLMGMSWKSNLEPKLRYLSNWLDLDTQQLKLVVRATPRIFLYSLEKSIKIKLSMIDNRLRHSGSHLSTRYVICQNPAILTTTIDQLQKRLDLAEENSSKRSLAEALLPRSFRTQEEPLWSENDSFSSHDLLEEQVTLSPPGKKQEKSPKTSGAVSHKSLLDELASSAYRLEREYAPGVVPIVIYASGAVYPTDSMTKARGSVQAGGVSLFFPQVTYGSNRFQDNFLRISEACFGPSVPERGSDIPLGVALGGFAGMWPSRTRTELAACNSALKMIFQMVGQEAVRNPFVRVAEFQIDVYTSSEAVWRLLNNTTQLLEWAEDYNSTDSFKTGTVGYKVSNNPDLLFPLCRTVQRMVSNSSITDKDGNPCGLGRKLRIRFLHKSEGNPDDENIRSLGRLARRVAKWYFLRENAVL